ncbi:type IV secretion system protein [Sinorhizobium meliloti]|uniref:type IV secretion system protein n=1 Tax=Rhizobium meliloti TaxID=382 RepID=UPI000FD282F6|nr:type IV secretion system protein [Sinorhizobium meliloti]RVL89307.1 conjugal transfer protein [Sinorhizobium meliloti]RVN80519.1 conjugal transfer protein [Sinorhizobium meliloti]RVO50072.1 conjugal transfer protein [Sinorhizobium meliloti]
MGIITELSVLIDKSLTNYQALVFAAAAQPVLSLLNAVAIVGLFFIAIDHLIQFRNINYSVYLQWFLRYILINTFAIFWVNFEGIYGILNDVPGDYAAIMLKSIATKIVTTTDREVLDPARITDVYSAMDEFSHAIIYLANRDYLSQLSIWNVGKSLRNIFMGGGIVVIGAFFTAASAIIVLLAKVGLAVAISIAPLAIVMLMLPQTKQYFESWMRFTVGFAIIPLLNTALMSILLYVASEILRTTVKGSFAFIFVMIAATVLLYMIPTMASTLASASVAAVGAGALGTAISSVTSTYSNVKGAGRRLEDVARVASSAREAGASRKGAAWAGINAMRQSSNLRKQRRDERLARRIIEPERRGNAARSSPNESSR